MTLSDVSIRRPVFTTLLSVFLVVTDAVRASIPSQELRQLIKDKLEPQLAQVGGVAEVRVTGGDTREVRVDVDLNKAKSAGIAPPQIAERLGMENLNLPAGRLD